MQENLKVLGFLESEQNLRKNRMRGRGGGEERVEGFLGRGGSRAAFVAAPSGRSPLELCKSSLRVSLILAWGVLRLV